jgi:hypothetical protein
MGWAIFSQIHLVTLDRARHIFMNTIFIAKIQVLVKNNYSLLREAYALEDVCTADINYCNCDPQLCNYLLCQGIKTFFKDD